MRQKLIRLLAATALALAAPGSGASVAQAATTTPVRANYNYDHSARLAQHAFWSSRGRAGATGLQEMRPSGDLASLRFVRRVGVAAEEGETTILRGVAEDHHAFEDALQGTARPGDPLGHADPVLHNEGFTYNSRLTSWTTDPSLAAERAGPNGVILRTTLEEMRRRGVPIIASPDAYQESEILLEGVIRGLEVTR